MHMAHLGQVLRCHPELIEHPNVAVQTQKGAAKDGRLPRGKVAFDPANVRICHALLSIEGISSIAAMYQAGLNVQATSSATRRALFIAAKEHHQPSGADLSPTLYNP